MKGINISKYLILAIPPLSLTAIQFLAFCYPERSLPGKGDCLKCNGYPIFGDVILNSIKLENFKGLIMKKK